MNTIDFSFSILIILIVTGFGIEIINTLHEKTRHALFAFDAKALAENCAALIDSFYANGGGKFLELKTGCYTENEKIHAVKNGFIKSSFSIAPAKKISASENGTVIEVYVEKHYGQ